MKCHPNISELAERINSRFVPFDPVSGPISPCGKLLGLVINKKNISKGKKVQVFIPCHRRTLKITPNLSLSWDQDSMDDRESISSQSAAAKKQSAAR